MQAVTLARGDRDLPNPPCHPPEPSHALDPRDDSCSADGAAGRARGAEVPRNATLPERVPPEGLLIVRNGTPGDRRVVAGASRLIVGPVCVAAGKANARILSS